MKQTFTYYPIKFFFISFFISTLFWLSAAYVSLQETMQQLLFPLIIGGMSGPTISAFLIFAQSNDKNMISDFLQRLNFKKIKIQFLLVVLLLMPSLIILAITTSLLFGCSANQFLISAPADEALQGINFLTLIVVLFLSCSLEEIGWRGYGIDSLNSKFNLYKTSLVFAIIWSLWHVPAFFIKDGYFQKELLNLGSTHVVVYFMSLFPITILINWLYFQNNRSVLIAILFHTIMNLSYGIFPIQLLTKIIIMMLLYMVAGIVVITNKKLFFEKSL